MSTAAAQPAEWKMPSTRKVAVISLILTESALFTIFLVAYLFYMGKSLNPPYPSKVLEFPLLATIALLSSSVTIVFSEKALHRGNKGGFHFWWAVTIALGAYFLWFTAMEWKHLIFQENLTLATNVFGTTFYSLVGLHASHVIIGLVLLTMVLILSLLGKVPADHTEHLEMISWYWHFVDAIWIVVVTVVYIISTRT
ncbi:MAG: heme-copper oxidase subunit III [Verrucomicrobiaceae bacterium]|nr:MAG: heme-copper oxidase subunit III [Verrucomicrobiaceae bacterium]